MTYVVEQRVGVIRDSMCGGPTGTACVIRRGGSLSDEQPLLFVGRLQLGKDLRLGRR